MKHSLINHKNLDNSPTNQLKDWPTVNDPCSHQETTICSRGVQLGINDLQTLFPEIAKEWDYENNGGLTPEMVTTSSCVKVMWKCKFEHTWVTSVYSRTKNNSQCPYCSGKLPIPGKNDLSTLYPDVADEWDFERNGDQIPQNFLPKSNKKVAWVCKEGHKWIARIADRTNGTDCPYCSGKLPIPGETDLVTLYPDVAAEWDYEANKNLTPDKVLPGSEKKVGWICAKGHHYKASIGNRTRNHSGCPYCARKIAIPGVNDLLTLHPEVATEWDKEKNGLLKPQNVMPYTHKDIWWKCKNGHRWNAAISSRVKGAKCPYCQGLLPIPGETDLASQNPALALQWDFDNNGALTSQDVSVRSNKKVWWKCPECGHKWKASVYNRSRGSRCPVCFTSKH